MGKMKLRLWYMLCSSFQPLPGVGMEHCSGMQARRRARAGACGTRMRPASAR